MWMSLSGEWSHEEVCPGATLSGCGERLETEFSPPPAAGRPQPLQGDDYGQETHDQMEAHDQMASVF